MPWVHWHINTVLKSETYSGIRRCNRCDNSRSCKTPKSPNPKVRSSSPGISPGAAIAVGAMPTPLVFKAAGIPCMVWVGAESTA